MDISIFTDKESIPTDNDLKNTLVNTFDLWLQIVHYVHGKFPDALDEWNYPGAKYGWSFRIRDKKRAIIYLLPRDKYFKVAFVFGQKATDAILKSDISQDIRSELENARLYAEGRGIRIDIRNDEILRDILLLTDIKIAS